MTVSSNWYSKVINNFPLFEEENQTVFCIWHCKIWNTREITTFSNLILHAGRAKLPSSYGNTTCVLSLSGLMGQVMSASHVQAGGLSPGRCLMPCGWDRPRATGCPASGWGWDGPWLPPATPSPQGSVRPPWPPLWISHPIIWVMCGYLVISFVISCGFCECYSHVLFWQCCLFASLDWCLIS